MNPRLEIRRHRHRFLTNLLTLVVIIVVMVGGLGYLWYRCNDLGAATLLEAVNAIEDSIN